MAPTVGADAVHVAPTVEPACPFSFEPSYPRHAGYVVSSRRYATPPRNRLNGATRHIVRPPPQRRPPFIVPLAKRRRQPSCRHHAVYAKTSFYLINHVCSPKRDACLARARQTEIRDDVESRWLRAARVAAGGLFGKRCPTINLMTLFATAPVMLLARMFTLAAIYYAEGYYAMPR